MRASIRRTPSTKAIRSGREVGVGAGGAIGDHWSSGRSIAASIGVARSSSWSSSAAIPYSGAHDSTLNRICSATVSGLDSGDGRGAADLG